MLNPPTACWAKHKKGIDIYASGTNPAGWGLKWIWQNHRFCDQRRDQHTYPYQFQQREKPLQKKSLFRQPALGSLKLPPREQPTDKTFNSNNGEKNWNNDPGKPIRASGAFQHYQLHDTWELRYVDNIIQKGSWFPKRAPNPAVWSYQQQPKS